MVGQESTTMQVEDLGHTGTVRINTSGVTDSEGQSRVPVGSAIVPSITRQTHLKRLFDDFYRPLMLRSGSSGTTGLYHLCIRHLGDFLGRPAIVADFSDDTLGRYAAKRRSDGKAVPTVNGELAKFRAMWNFTCKRGVLKVWPTIEDEPEPMRVPMAWLEEELQALWRACQAADGMIGDVPAADFWMALSLFIWDTGERIGAVLSVRTENLDRLGGWVRVPAEVRKGRVKEQLYKLHPETLTAILKILRPKQSLVFAWPYTPKYLWIHWGQILESAGLSADRRSKFHRIRRSFASYAKRNGLDATQLLGHESQRTTVLYLDPRIVTQQHAVDVLFRPGPLAGPQGV